MNQYLSIYGPCIYYNILVHIKTEYKYPYIIIHGPIFINIWHMHIFQYIGAYKDKLYCIIYNHTWYNIYTNI